MYMSSALVAEITRANIKSRALAFLGSGQQDRSLSMAEKRKH